MFGAVTGMASRSHYLWLGATLTKFYEHSGSKRPDVFDYSLVYGYRPPKWRRSPDQWDWRMFAELVGEHSDRFVLAGTAIPQTQAHQVFLGPSLLGIYRNYTVGFGAQAPIYQSAGSRYPRERVRFAVNFSYLLFQHKHWEKSSGRRLPYSFCWLLQSHCPRAPKFARSISLSSGWIEKSVHTPCACLSCL